MKILSNKQISKINQTIEKQHLIIMKLQRENAVLRNDINTLKSMITTQAINIDFPNTTYGGEKEKTGFINVDDILSI